jgi:hypothetical protein
MRNFSFEPIIVLIIFILIPLANYVLERPVRGGNRCRIWASGGKRLRQRRHPRPLASMHRRRRRTA